RPSASSVATSHRPRLPSSRIPPQRGAIASTLGFFLWHSERDVATDSLTQSLPLPWQGSGDRRLFPDSEREAGSNPGRTPAQEADRREEWPPRSRSSNRDRMPAAP